MNIVKFSYEVTILEYLDYKYSPEQQSLFLQDLASFGVFLHDEPCSQHVH